MHWNRIDGWRINKYLALIRKHLVVFLKHINSIWDSNAAAVTNYINSIFEETLRGKDVPLGVGMQIADVYLEEISKNFDKSQLSHERITQLLCPFLKALGKCEQFVLFKRIMDSVFVKLVESNGADSDKSGDLYLPNFKIVDYAEDEIFPIASSNETIATRRDDIYKIYEKASGNERPAAPYVPYEERIKQIKLNSQKLPQTKHQKKKLMRQKIKQVQKIKKRLLKLIRKQQQIPVSDAHHDKIEGHIIGHHTEETQKMEEITKIAIDKINSNAEKNKVDTNLASADGTGGTGDKIIEISNTQGKKKKNKNKKVILKESLDNSKKKVSFELKNNKTKEFYMHGQVGESKIPKSKDLKSKRPSIIKRKHRKS